MQKKIPFEIVTIHAVNQGDDDRSNGHPRWFFTEEYKAKDVAKGRGWYNGNAPISKHSALIINGEAYLLSSTHPVQLNITPEDEVSERQRVLAKLTPEDKKILGIK